MLRVRHPFIHTVGFVNLQDFAKHYEKHRRENPAFATAYGYARFADEFCGGPLGANTLEHVRRDNGSTVRFDTGTQIAGILHVSGVIGTCHVRQRNGLAWFQREQMR
jgi:hypothetical protein